MRTQDLATDRHWFGHLTLENSEAVADRLRRLIGDGQRYTWVANNEIFGLKPEVRTSQRAEKVLHEPGHVWVNDTYGVWGFSTSVKDNQDAHSRKRDDRDLVYLNFEYNRLEIRHFAPGGNELFWVISLERGDH